MKKSLPLSAIQGQAFTIFVRQASSLSHSQMVRMKSYQSERVFDGARAGANWNV